MKKTLREALLTHSIDTSLIKNNIEEGWFGDTAKRVVQTAKGAAGIGGGYNPHGVGKSILLINWYDESVSINDNIKRLQSELRANPKSNKLKDIKNVIIKLNKQKKFQEYFNLIKKSLNGTNAIQNSVLDDGEDKQIKSILNFIGNVTV